MNDEAEDVHVAWGLSRAESIREALRSMERDARVVALSGVYNVGPIDPSRPDARQAWIKSNLRGEPREDWGNAQASWTEATSRRVRPVYWVCRTDAGEHACFLEFASRMAGRPFDIVDATGLEFVTNGGISPIRSLGALRPEAIVASGLVTRRRPFTRAESDTAMVLWSRLREEDAPLRVVRDGSLVSAPLTHFDPVLIAQALPDWEVVARLIGRVLHHLSVEVDPPGQGTSDEVLFARVFALAQDGALDLRGAGRDMRDCMVRRAADLSSLASASDTRMQ